MQCSTYVETAVNMLVKVLFATTSRSLSVCLSHNVSLSAFLNMYLSFTTDSLSKV